VRLGHIGVFLTCFGPFIAGQKRRKMFLALLIVCQTVFNFDMPGWLKQHEG
jgi:hypothetical protein